TGAGAASGSFAGSTTATGVGSGAAGGGGQGAATPGAGAAGGAAPALRVMVGRPAQPSASAATSRGRISANRRCCMELPPWLSASGDDPPGLGHEPLEGAEALPFLAHRGGEEVELMGEGG